MDEPSRQEIWKMFDAISSTYDRVNRVMTFRLDVRWRKQLCRFLPQRSNLRILDCATGTGDQIVTLMRNQTNIDSIVGIDLAASMLEIARKKIKESAWNLNVLLHIASALDLPFEQSAFDCVTISFGIRNVTDVPQALAECFRVLKSHGKVLILEGTIPKKSWLKSLHLFYLRHFLPRIGKALSKHPHAYRYLNETIETFPQGDAFCALLKASGFSEVKAHPLLGGIATIYEGSKN